MAGWVLLRRPPGPQSLSGKLALRVGLAPSVTVLEPASCMLNLKQIRRKIMNPKKLVTAGLLLCFGCVMPVFAANTVSVDMDLGTAGIQSTRVVAPGDMFQIGLVLTVDASGVSSFGISALFNTPQLQLNGSPA